MYVTFQKSVQISSKYTQEMQIPQGNSRYVTSFKRGNYWQQNQIQGRENTTEITINKQKPKAYTTFSVTLQANL